MIQEIKKWKIKVEFADTQDKKRITEGPLYYVFEIYDDSYINMLRKLAEFHIPFGLEINRLTIEG